ncbi:hypothetical protein CJF30_00010852 [Rutstroemia sp. NJR-2017a BBW]|nr:hypothetical protein CJF30_00010852 [Rutstroemia sp. NJR-2017a BBW]
MVPRLEEHIIMRIKDALLEDGVKIDARPSNYSCLSPEEDCLYLKAAERSSTAEKCRASAGLEA